MFGGIELDLIPAIASEGAVRRVVPARRGKAWLSSELIIRAERLGLEELPEALWRKTTARQLLLTGNALAALPPALSALRELRVLLLGGNRLRQLPEEVCELSQLRRLEAQDNLLESVPTGLARLVHLSLVNLDGNPLGARLVEGGPTLLQVWLGPESIQDDARSGGGAIAVPALSYEPTEVGGAGEQQGAPATAEASDSRGGAGGGGSGGDAGGGEPGPVEEEGFGEELPVQGSRPSSGGGAGLELQPSGGAGLQQGEGSGGGAEEGPRPIQLAELREGPETGSSTVGDAAAGGVGGDGDAGTAGAGRIEPGGSTARTAGEAAGGATAHQGAAASPATGDGAGSGRAAAGGGPQAAAGAGAAGPAGPLSARAGGAASERRRAAAEAAAGAAVLRRRTERLLRYLLALQDPSEALAVKQAKLQQLQSEARERVAELARMADPQALAACRAIAQDAGLGPEAVARVDAAAAATARLQAAAAGEDRSELRAALAAFQELCRPRVGLSRPDGAAFHAAQQRLRALLRRDLERGWRAASEEARRGSGGGDGGSLSDGGGGERAAGGGAETGGGGGGGGGGAQREPSAQAPGELPQRRVFLTMAELRRRELQAAGAKSYEHWARAKAEAAESEARARAAAAAAARRARRAAAAARGDRAVELHELEQTWPSRVVDPYPRGTFSPARPRERERRPG
ncbi:hypothetical protein Rsub_04404 [Raphidocelis subcapitata]|uniref:Uncharacterized protein n=1 Tax=Raphidocelis subcapitata TaxID=307507 RepID=A0A2V0P4D7_9CHLO|nr:hypothetical protein Rsub_04404 [Raphidocelis subcapitata]|eukprot:GBF92057.1 hypothetical protein Rsub_04404 [Raphidocelis subcapitata]